MEAPANDIVCRALFARAEGQGRGPLLFGADAGLACENVLPFVEGVPFPKLYLEFPLAGEPFLDVTAIYGEIPRGLRFDHPAAAGTDRLLDWFATACQEYEDTYLGFELDSGAPEGTLAGVHLFHPLGHAAYAVPFLEALGKPGAGRMYADKAARMPEGWPLAFVSVFRGRPGSPLRICGYMSREEQRLCAQDPTHVREAFEQIGFSAFDDAMLAQVCEVLAAASGGVDFQFDLMEDGSVGDTFAFDVSFPIMRTERDALAYFQGGNAARLMGLLEGWGIADGRWRAAPGMALARAIPTKSGEGGEGRLVLMLAPQWLKVRWRGGALQPAKLYCYGTARDRYGSRCESDDARNG